MSCLLPIFHTGLNFALLDISKTNDDKARETFKPFVNDKTYLFSTNHLCHANVTSVEFLWCLFRNNIDSYLLVAEKWWTADGTTQCPDEKKARETENFTLQYSRFGLVENSEITV